MVHWHTTWLSIVHIKKKETLSDCELYVCVYGVGIALFFAQFPSVLV